MNKYNRLQKFRLDTHQMLIKSNDATFELMDSIMTTQNAHSLAEFSLSPFFSRKWPSTYEAIEDCRPNTNKLMKRYIQEIPPLEYILLGIDHTPWEFRDSPSMKDLTYQYSHSSVNSSVVGQGYSTIAWLPSNECDNFPSADKILEMEDSSLGQIRISKWNQLHFYYAPLQTLCLFKVERLKPKKTGNEHRPLWLIWVGEEILSLEKIWSQYARRFGVDHWYRFAKQRLHWTKPNFRTPVQCQRWSDLIVNITWQLWLSKDLVQEYHLPWQKPQENLTPQRVAQSMMGLLVEIGTPAGSAKSRGKSQGWEKGRKRNKANVYPIIKKRQSKSKKRRKN